MPKDEGTCYWAQRGRSNRNEWLFTYDVVPGPSLVDWRTEIRAVRALAFGDLKQSQWPALLQSTKGRVHSRADCRLEVVRIHCPRSHASFFQPIQSVVICTGRSTGDKCGRNQSNRKTGERLAESTLQFRTDAVRPLDDRRMLSGSPSTHAASLLPPRNVKIARFLFSRVPRSLAYGACFLLYTAPFVNWRRAVAPRAPEKNV